MEQHDASDEWWDMARRLQRFSGPRLRLLKLLLGAGGVTLFSYFLLKGGVPKLAWGLFILVQGVALVVKHGASALTGPPKWLLAALAATALQSGVEISFSNIVVSLAILIALVGELSFRRLPTGRARLAEAIRALVESPERWWRLGRGVRKAIRNEGALARGGVRLLQIVLPAVILVAVFSFLLARGNSIYASWISTLEAFVIDCIAVVDISLGRVLLFLILGTVSLWLLVPAAVGRLPWGWARRVRRPRAGNPAVAWWRSCVILVGLNLLFFQVNSIDAIYLWGEVHLPKGMTHSKYVYQGVHSLIIAALLSGCVLAVLFKHGGGLAASLLLKRLAYAWIAQNFLLIAGVFLRLARYTDAFSLSTLRVYLFAFLLLVSVGFLLLLIYVGMEKTLGWLFLSNGLALFALFFIMQFLNVAGGVAEYNVRCWERQPERKLDIGYLAQLGLPAVPALKRVAASDKKEAEVAEGVLSNMKQEAKWRSAWRSWQARPALIAKRYLRSE